MRRETETASLSTILTKGRKSGKSPRTETRETSGVGEIAVGALATLGAVCVAAAFVGCASLNENPKNDRFWFPTLRGPSEEERQMREKYYPEGGDPYMDSEIGPKSLSVRPNGWDAPRARTSTTLGVVQDVDYGY